MNKLIYYQPKPEDVEKYPFELPEVEVVGKAPSTEVMWNNYKKRVNDYALQNPTLMFENNPKTASARRHLSDNTWEEVIRANSLTDPADPRWRMAPEKFRSKAMERSTRKAMNDFAPYALGIGLAPAAIAAAPQVITTIGSGITTIPQIVKAIGPLSRTVNFLSKTPNTELLASGGNWLRNLSKGLISSTAVSEALKYMPKETNNQTNTNKAATIPVFGAAVKETLKRMPKSGWGYVLGAATALAAPYVIDWFSKPDNPVQNSGQIQKFLDNPDSFESYKETPHYYNSQVDSTNTSNKVDSIINAWNNK